MNAWKPFAIAVTALIGTPVMAAENNNPFQAALMLTTIVPAVIVSGATAATSSIPELFKSAKDDALVFIGSEGQIRGAQIEQATRDYRQLSGAPLLSDMQLAQAIAISF